ncbi:MAG TPA: putative baseplate assembly protein [Acidimicrobiales bacterium]|jgi:predicted phage baseplate assembly protein|nr:putative baseplate assembly protein [Acidimicrobiales bacterium]
MTLPTPELDDRTFQNLVDDAKRLVQVRCPEWTDHNVSDPGVTLIETFAYVTSQLIYRLNRVPDRLYVKFLELIGVRLLPPTPARAQLTFWLSAPQPGPVVIPAGSLAATLRTDTEQAISFSTTTELPINPSSVGGMYTSGSEDGGPWTNREVEMSQPGGFPAFSDVPQPGEALVIALDEAVPSCVIRLRFKCRVEGVGVDPANPPLQWQAWNGSGWEVCVVESDGTGGLNTNGDVILHMPRNHENAVIAGRLAGWVRCHVTPNADNQPAYSSSPLIDGLEAATIGGTTEAIHAEIIETEDLGESEGIAGQRFELQRRPVLGGVIPPIVEASSEDGWVEWTSVTDFSRSGESDRHFVLDAAMGEVQFGPAIRVPTGDIVSYGAVPPQASHLRIRGYAIGGGRSGNVGPRTISVLKSSIPYVSRVENRGAAQGGVDGETIDQAKVRGPLLLRARGRAVTADDFEQLTREAAPEIARVRCYTAEDGSDPGAVRVQIVPTSTAQNGRIEFEDLLPDESTLDAISERLGSARLVGTRVLIEPPQYQGVTVVARLKSKPKADPNRVQAEALDLLYAYINPINGGPERDGWPFGRPVQAGEIYGVLQKVAGLDMVDDVILFAANPVSGDRGPALTRIDMVDNALAFSFEHEVLVESS